MGSHKNEDIPLSLINGSTTIAMIKLRRVGNSDYDQREQSDVDRHTTAYRPEACRNRPSGEKQTIAHVLKGNDSALGLGFFSHAGWLFLMTIRLD